MSSATPTAPLSLRHVIIGAGEAGTRAALALRAAGARHVTLIGAEPHPPYERPPLSKPESDGVAIRPIAPCLDGINTRFGIAVAALDRSARQIRLADGQVLGYDRLLLATGAQPRRLPTGPTAQASGLHVLRKREDAEAIYAAAAAERFAVIIGAGLIGLELAAALRGRGMAVTVVEAASRPLGRALPAALADHLAQRHRAAGVRLVFDATIARITANSLELDDGTRLPADLVVVAIGVTPDTALAAAAGLPCDNGILVDAQLTTADPAIFSAGDCAALDHPLLGRSRFETWRNACDQGEMAARAMLGEPVRFTAQPWFWSDHYDLGIQMVGRHDPARSTIRRDLPCGGFLLFETDSAGRLCAASGLSSGRGIAKDIRLAEMLIANEARPAPEALADAGISLKSLLPR